MEEEKKSEGNQEGSKWCGSGHGCRCGVKVIGAFVLILLGWIVGFLMGHGGLCRGGKQLCNSSMMSGTAGCPMMETKQNQTAAPAK